MPFFFDRLPVEIVYIIFNYLWAHEILYAFYRISDYFNRVLSHYDYFLINFESIRKSHFDLVCRLIKPEQVISLILSDKTDTPYQSSWFLSIFRMKNFTRLRALKLIEVNDNSKSFSFDLYNLQHLVSLEIDVKTDLPWINSIPPLKRLSINILSCEHFNIKRLTTRISFEQLHQLSLSNCPATELQRILSQAIRLTSLKMSFKYLNNEYINILANFHQEQSTKSTLVYLSLSIDVAPTEQITTYARPMNHIGISVTDINAALTWYREVLGFTVLVAPVDIIVDNSTDMGILLSQMFPPEMKRVKMAHMTAGNGVGFELFQFIDPPTQRPNTSSFEYSRAGLFHICVTDPEPENLVRRIVATGGKQLSPVLTVFSGEIYQAVYCLDPFGNLVEIMATSYERQMSNRDSNVTNQSGGHTLTSRSSKSQQLVSIGFHIYLLTLFFCRPS
ncbi:unnamed protein product [Rotaria sp. Silwood1]|nr:unnamed protein product [Rotaria sp. Silwood1]